MTVPQVSRGCKSPRGGPRIPQRALGSPGEFRGEATGWWGEKGMENSPSSPLAAPGCGVHALRGPGRAGQHGARLPDDCPLPLPRPLLRRPGQAEVAVFRGRALLPRLLQAGALQLLAGRCRATPLPRFQPARVPLLGFSSWAVPKPGGEAELGTPGSSLLLR